MHYCPSCGYNLERDPVITIDGYRLDPTAGTVWRDGYWLPLSRSEFHLLYSLAAAKGRVVAKQPLMLRISDGETESIVNVFVSRIRAKLLDAGWPNLIETVWGRGYRWAPGAAVVDNRPKARC